MVDQVAKEIIENFDRGNDARLTYLSHCQECANYMQPDRADYLVTRTPGQKRMQWIFDSSPLFNLEQYANMLHSFLTNPSVRWFSRHLENERLDQIGEVRAWLEDCDNVSFGQFSGSAFNFAAASHEYYMDLGLIGQGIMAQLESVRSGVLFSTRHTKECVFFENEEDRIDWLIRCWDYTAKQAVEAWGAAAGEKVMKAFMDGKEQAKFKFYHSVKPRKSRDPQRRDKKHKAFESIYISHEDGTVISESGFDDFPYHVARLGKATGEITGRGRGMYALPDVKMLNEMVKTVIKAAQKVVDPPLMIPDDGFLLPIRTVPGSRNFYRATSQAEVKPIKTEGQIELGVEMINALRDQIKKTFYLDAMEMPTDPNNPTREPGKGVTATYTMNQRDQGFRMLSSMLARLNREFTGPLLERNFNINMQKSKDMNFGPGSPFKRPPAILSGQKYRVEYLSPIAVAQRSSELDSANRLLQLQEQFRQMDPDGAMIIDEEAYMRLSGRDLNAPSVILKTPQKLAQEIAEKKKAEAAQAQSEQAANLGGAVADATKGVHNLAQAKAAGNQRAA